MAAGGGNGALQVSQGSDNGIEPDAPPVASVKPGDVLRGTYRILHALDEGGMGTVFAAEHTRLKRQVAVKVMAQHLATDADALARFHREAEIISQLAHPHIVHVQDFDTTPAGEPYLVMELLQGESLASRLEREQRLPLSETVRITWQVAVGLAAAHDLGIVHRDLKPGNIFLVQLPGSASFVKLLDFGISKGSAGSRKLTREFDILGTPDYMAPEQALGKTANVDARADQFSLACIAFECLAGRMPFIGKNVMAVLEQIIKSPPANLRELVPDAPANVQAVLERALSKKPTERFDTITDFAIELAQAADCPLPSSATASSTPPSARKPRAIVAPDAKRNAATARTQAAHSHAGEYAFPDGAPSEPPISQRDSLTELGGLQRRVRPSSPPTQRRLSALTPPQAFLLSRLEDGLSVEEALDVSPMSRDETLDLLADLARDKLIDLE